MKTKKFIVEVEKGLNWNHGYLNWKGEVVEDIKEANEWDNEEEAQDAASLFNIEYGRGGRIYAKVR
jgi:hypothetical protein